MMTSSQTIELESVSYAIITLLKKYPKTRNSDKLLMELFYRFYEGKEINLSAVNTSPATLVRSRRFAQKHNPSLKGIPEVEILRESHSKEFKRFFSDRETDVQRFS